MVLEHLFSERWLERRFRYAFLLAVVYSSVGIIASRLLFAANSGIVSVVFTSLLLLPYLKKLISREEQRQLKQRVFSPTSFWQDNREALKVYLALFLGVYAVYLFSSFILPQLGYSVPSVFREQHALELNLRGGASEMGTLGHLLLNNWWVLLACFLVALVAGDGALFFVIWNASAWGTIFGFRAVEAAGSAYNPWINLAVIVLITLPHVVLEATAYILAAISGGLLSEDVLSQRKAAPFLYAFVAALVLFLVLSFVLGRAGMGGMGLQGLQVVMVLLFLHLSGLVFSDARHRRAFRSAYYLFLAALSLFVIGALVESLVISNSLLLNRVYLAAFG